MCFLANRQDERRAKAQVGTEYSYFFGLLRFRSKIIWHYLFVGVLLHISAIYGLFLVCVHCLNGRFATTLFGYLYLSIGMIGASAGVHRLWAHRSFKATMSLQIILMIFQTISSQLSIYNWSKRHRVHHKYSDTDLDPHSSNRGFFFCHIGWFVLESLPECEEKIRTYDMSSYDKDPVVSFQDKHYVALFAIFSLFIPVLAPVYLWGENWIDAFAICFTARVALSLHFTFTVNSLGHMYGNKPYDKYINPTENVLSSFVTYGEGWHNYHHAFPIDYKNSEYGMPYNFSATFIEWCAKIGLAYDLKTASPQVIDNTMEKKGDGSKPRPGHPGKS